MTVTEKFMRAMLGFGLQPGKKKVLVALSGGGDSVALLNLLCKNGYIVAAAHVNHMIRGAEADRDENFCRDLCAGLAIPFFTSKIDVPSIAAKTGRGIEETARDERYLFLSQIAEEKGFDRIAVAHNATDNCETVLFNLARGCGPEGLAGIPACRDNIIRPLLYCSKQEILDYCDRKGLSYVTDSTNSDVTYTRNKIRHTVLPVLREINPRIEESVSRACDALKEENRFIAETAAEYSLSSGRKTLAGLSDAVLSRVLINSLKDGGLSPESSHIDEIKRIIRSGSANSSVSVPGGTVRFSRNEISLREVSRRTGTEIKNGVNKVSGSEIVLLADRDNFEEISGEIENVYILSTKATINSDIISEGFFLRSRKDGDTLRFGGITRKVKKLLQSRKDTLSERARTPIFTNGSEIIWIPGFPVADSAKGTDKTVGYYIRKDVT